eukprot:g2513.t1
MSRFAQNWRKRMHAEMAREIDDDICRSKSGFARYRPGMTADDLKAVLDFSQRDYKGARLPSKPGLQAEIRRFMVGKAKTPARQKVLTSGRVDELTKLLAEVLDHEPRRWVSARRDRRFGLTFDYKGAYPGPVYREDMGSEELRAMLELYPGAVKVSAAQLKERINKEEAWPTTKPSGTKADLMERLARAVGGGRPSWAKPQTYELVGCWKDEREALQAKFDAEKAAWQKELESDPTAAKAAGEANKAKKKAADKKQQAQHQEKENKREAEQEADTRPWRAVPYDPATTTRADMEAIWRKNHADEKLSFAYSGSSIPPPEAFSQVLKDWKANRARYGHHLLAYLEVGYGTFEFNKRFQASHAFMNKYQLKEIHGRQCTALGTSHGHALRFLRATVPGDARSRFESGL